MRFYKDWSLIRRLQTVAWTSMALGVLLYFEGLFPTGLEGVLILLLLLNGFFYVFAVHLPLLESDRVYYRFVRGYDPPAVLMEAVPYAERQRLAVEKLRKLLDDHQVIRLSNRQAQYLALQNQINPHFLYNTLEAIRGDALSEGLESLAETTEALATFFRYTISNMETQVTLEEELANAENYFSIQKYRFGERIHLTIDMEPQGDRAGRCLIPKLTLQPILENAILHGLEQKVGPGTVIIRIRLGQRLTLEVTDDGAGIPENRLAALNQRLQSAESEPAGGNSGKGGIALDNVQRRIRLLYGERYGLRVHSIPEVGTRVVVELPVLRRQEGQTDEG